MRVKGEMIEAYMQQKQLTTGLLRGDLLKAHGLSFAIFHKAKKGMDLFPMTIFRFGEMLGCDPMELVVEEDLPKVGGKKRPEGG